MKLESDGILISLRPIGERDSLARIFTREFGLMGGVMRGAVVARRNRPLVGQCGVATWNARLDSQLGAFHWDSERNLSAPIMMNMSALSAMNAAFDLIVTLLPERESYENLYQKTLDLLSQLARGDVADAYQRWEIVLLGELGYALDLSHCSGCGGVDNLNYLSPRTGRAVCDACAAPYMDQVFRLPLNLDITLAFLTRICDALGATMPASRRRLDFVK